MLTVYGIDVGHLPGATRPLGGAGGGKHRPGAEEGARPGDAQTGNLARVGLPGADGRSLRSAPPGPVGPGGPRGRSPQPQDPQARSGPEALLGPAAQCAGPRPSGARGRAGQARGPPLPEPRPPRPWPCAVLPGAEEVDAAARGPTQARPPGPLRRQRRPGLPLPSSPRSSQAGLLPLRPQPHRRRQRPAAPHCILGAGAAARPTKAREASWRQRGGTAPPAARAANGSAGTRLPPRLAPPSSRGPASARPPTTPPRSATPPAAPVLTRSVHAVVVTWFGGIKLGVRPRPAVHTPRTVTSAAGQL